MVQVLHLSLQVQPVDPPLVQSNQISQLLRKFAGPLSVLNSRETIRIDVQELPAGAEDYHVREIIWCEGRKARKDFGVSHGTLWGFLLMAE